MNKRLLGAALILSGLTACAPQDNVMVDLGDVDDYAEFLETRDEDDAPQPFKAEPLQVSAIGKVRAQPDIALITATISAEDKNESRAVNLMSETVNAVQDALSGQTVETGFTAVTSQREFDQACLNANHSAWQRHNQINNDYWFNRRLDQRGDTKTKRRNPKPRIAENVCAAQKIKVATQMVIRIQPADAAGEALRALSNAGAENARLYGYDFTDYDALYQAAAEKAVKMARGKAETTARLAGATLGEIENFSITAPARTSRFGPQPNVIRPARPFKGQSGSVVDRQTNNKFVYPSAPPAMQTCWDGSISGARQTCPVRPMMTCSNGKVVSNGGSCSSLSIGSEDDEIIVTATKRASGYDNLTETIVMQEASTELVRLPNGQTTERVIPAVTKTRTRRVSQSGSTTNALSMSLLSGPQTISVTANLSYDYETPLDGKIIMEGED